MAQRESDDAVAKAEDDGHTRLKPEPDPLPVKAEGSAYKSPNPYPSPQLQSQQPYTPSQDPSLQLPPIKSVEGFSQALPQYTQVVPANMQPDSQPTAYYKPASQITQYPPIQTELAASAHAQAMRQPIQPALAPGERMLSNDKHRKEIKRRTKTGCLTCRKRRIKCDETHPVCRNCLKSKRECAGYDPIFKQQSSHYELQASAGALSSSRSTPISLAPESVVYHPVPLGYAPATGPRYSHHSTGSYSPASSQDQHCDYGSAIDPALASGDPAGMAASGSSTGGEGNAVNTANVREHRSPYASMPEAGQNGMAKRYLRIEDLYMIGGADPPTPRLSQPVSSEMLEQIKYLYLNEYAKGIDQFLETTWYSTKGHDRLLADARLCEMFAGMLELFSTTKSDNYDTMRLLPLTESRMTWLLMCMPRDVQAAKLPPPYPDSYPPSSDSHLDTVLRRLSVFEHLITARPLGFNPFADADHLRTPQQPPPTPHEYRKLQFWRELGHHVTLDPAGTPPASAHEIDASLGRLRLLLELTENRDVLYSMAIVRRLGPSPQQQQHRAPGDVARGGPGASADEERNKLAVAKKFVEDEAAGKGTTQVVQRLCGMAVRSWAALR